MSVYKTLDSVVMNVVRETAAELNYSGAPLLICESHHNARSDVYRISVDIVSSKLLKASLSVADIMTYIKHWGRMHFVPVLGGLVVTVLAVGSEFPSSNPAGGDEF